MIKILKEGILPENRIYFIKCFNCCTEFTYQKDDIGVSQDSHNNMREYIQCPYCHGKIYITEKQKVLYHPLD